MNGLTALGDPTRQKIVEMLAQGELSAGEISQNFDMSAPAISQHLKVLKEAGLVQVRIEGQKRIYVLVPDGFSEIADWLNHVRRFWAGRLDKLEQELKKADERDGGKRNE
ncbi:MAG: metalloregulator ArsR/SmtB family transcription factor [Candidatus Obscuribacterales bacterium]|nr:metalloregulator ArsR/SmtB family transcription factor [Candidatus Obscuribacterales bacterium]